MRLDVPVGRIAGKRDHGPHAPHAGGASSGQKAVFRLAAMMFRVGCGDLQEELS
jgi:hypothetical protein